MMAMMLSAMPVDVMIAHMPRHMTCHRVMVSMTDHNGPSVVSRIVGHRPRGHDRARMTRVIGHRGRIPATIGTLIVVMIINRQASAQRATQGAANGCPRRAADLLPDYRARRATERASDDRLASIIARQCIHRSQAKQSRQQ